MSSHHNGKGMDGSHNAPNPSKFMKEIQALVPQLKAKGIIPMTREEARAQGDKGTNAAAIKAQLEHQRRLDLTGKRLDEHMRELAPFAFRLVLAFNWTWLFRALGYRYRVEPTKESVEGIPDIACTRIYIQRRIWPLPVKTVRAERLVWEEPGGKKPTRRIISP